MAQGFWSEEEEHINSQKMKGILHALKSVAHIFLVAKMPTPKNKRLLHLQVDIQLMLHVLVNNKTHSMTLQQNFHIVGIRQTAFVIEVSVGDIISQCNAICVVHTDARSETQLTSTDFARDTTIFSLKGYDGQICIPLELLEQNIQFSALATIFRTCQGSHKKARNTRSYGSTHHGLYLV